MEQPAPAMKAREAHTYIRKTNYFESVVHLLKANFGAGIFAMGEAFKHAGLLFGFFGTLFLGFICAYNARLLVTSAKLIKLKLGLDYLPNFPETVELCVQHGPLGLRKFTRCVRNWVKFSIISTQVGFCAIYMLFVARTAQSMMTQKYDFLPKDIRFYLCFVALIALITTLLPTLKILTPVSLTADCLLISGMLIAITLCTISGFPSVSSRPYIANFTTWPIFFGITIFAFEGIAIIIPLYNEINKQENFIDWYGVLNVSMSIVVSVTALMGFVGYLKFGEDIKETITLNFEEDVMSELLKIFVALGILLTYAIQFHVVVDVTWWDIVAKREHVEKVLCWEILYRVTLCCLTIIIAFTVPYLGIILSLIGSVLSNGLALMFPTMCDMCLRFCPAEEGRLEANNKFTFILRLFMNIITLLCALAGFFSGFIVNILELYHAITENPLGIF